jgi:maltose alpha-D-glucosyltransferase/alpha-amylase
MDAGAAWARYWSVWVGTTFLRSYLETVRSAPFIPADETALKVMLDVELLRKAIYELGYEMNNRPDWVKIAFQVLLDLLNPDNPI